MDEPIVEPVELAPEVAAPEPPAAPELEADVKPELLQRTVEFAATRPVYKAQLLTQLGAVSAEQYKADRLNDARKVAIATHNIPADMQEFVIGDSAEAIEANAAKLAAKLNPGPNAPEVSPTLNAPSATGKPPVKLEPHIPAPVSDLNLGTREGRIEASRRFREAQGQ